MCEEARSLIIGYLDSLEEYDRVHLMLLAAFRREDSEAIQSYRGLLQEVKSKVDIARERFLNHQTAHSCSQAIHFDSL
jgi:hypothetical protein